MKDDVVLPSLPSQLYIFGNNEVQFPSSEFYSSSHNKLHTYSSCFSISSKLSMEDLGDGNFVIPHHSLAANCQSGSSSSTMNRLDCLSSYCQTYIPSFSAIPEQSMLPGKKLIKISEFEPVISNAEKSPIEVHNLLLREEPDQLVKDLTGLEEFTKKKRKTWTIEKQQHRNQTATELVDAQNYKAPVIRRSQKLSDRITALQKLVSPYGKTDTASVLQEAVIYIKLLQERIKNASEVQNSSNPMLMARPIVPQMVEEHSFSMRRINKEINLPDLRSRGLRLVPVSMIPNLTRDDNYAEPHAAPSRNNITYLDPRNNFRIS